MGFILAHLHANHESGLSNQMQNSRSMGPEYAPSSVVEIQGDEVASKLTQSQCSAGSSNGAIGMEWLTADKKPLSNLETLLRFLQQKRVGNSICFFTSPPYSTAPVVGSTVPRVIDS